MIALADEVRPNRYPHSIGWVLEKSVGRYPNEAWVLVRFCISGNDAVRRALDRSGGTYRAYNNTTGEFIVFSHSVPIEWRTAGPFPPDWVTQEGLKGDSPEVSCQQS